MNERCLFFLFQPNFLFYLSQSVCEIFPCQCNDFMARCSSILRFIALGSGFCQVKEFTYIGVGKIESYLKISKITFFRSYFMIINEKE